MIRIILIRHGRTAWNVGEGSDKRFRGTVNVPLADEGVLQAIATSQRLASLPLAAVYCSPLQRAVRTAQIIAEPHGLVPQALPGLSSMNYGEWAGQFDADVARRWPDLYSQWLHDPFSIQIPGGDSMAELRDRACSALRTILSRHADGDTIVLVSHQVVTKTLVCAMAGLPNTAYWHFRQALCNLSCFDCEPGRELFIVAGLNDTCHLDPVLPRARSSGTRILLIRHGQTAWNEGAGEERFRGRTDLSLDETGWAQARAVSARLKREPVLKLYSSPLLRARQTMTPLAGDLGLEIEPHDGLLDIDYGAFQGLTHTRASNIYPELYTLWRARPGQVRFPGGEGLADVQARLVALLERLATCHPGQTIALTGHQIVNKVLMCTLLGLGLDDIWRIRQDTCGIDVFQRVGGNWYILCLNDTCHLR